MAFLGALGASVLVYATARSGGRLTSVRLLLAGVAVAGLLVTVVRRSAFETWSTP